MKHLKPLFENDNNRIINFQSAVEDIINYEVELGDIEPSTEGILYAIRRSANQFNMTSDDLRLVMKNLQPHEAKLVGIILNNTIKEEQRLTNYKYVLTKEDVMDIIQNYTDVSIPMNSLISVLEKYKKES